MGFIAIISLFLLLLGIPVYYGLRYLLGKTVCEERRREMVLWALTIVSTPILLVSILAIIFIYLNDYPSENSKKLHGIQIITSVTK